MSFYAGDNNMTWMKHETLKSRAISLFTQTLCSHKSVRISPTYHKYSDLVDHTIIYKEFPHEYYNSLIQTISIIIE